MALLEDRLRKDTRTLVGLTIVLVIVGIVFIYSSSSVFALEKFGSADFFLKKQLMCLIPSITGFFIFASLPAAFWKKYVPYFFLLFLILTILTLGSKFALRIHGSSRWLRILGFGFQPSEFLKLFLFMYLGLFLEKKQKNIGSLGKSYLHFFIILGITFFVLLKQPDFGSVAIIFITTLIIFFVAEFRMLHLCMALLIMLPTVVYLICTKAYRFNRILIFLNPWSDTKGRGFQIIQSLIAIGSGQIWGLGISNSKQKFFYLPMQHTDFIFPIIAEETGFVGSCCLIICYAIFLLFGLRIVLQLKSPFAFFTTFGFVVFISLQAVVNLMVTCGLLPTKGLGLPFVSYGGSALVVFSCMVGLIVNFARSSSIKTS
jgi:cell division protein FtsW